MTAYKMPITKGKLGIPKAQMYSVGLIPYRHDLKAMIIAFGGDLIARQLEIIVKQLELEKAEQAKLDAVQPKRRVRVKARR